MRMLERRAAKLVGRKPRERRGALVSIRWTAR
jgi:hypothetical protein